MPFYLLRPALLGKVSVDNFLNHDECRAIIESGESSLNLEAGTTEDRRGNIRQSDLAWLNPDGQYEWLFKRIKDCINEINAGYFGFTLMGFEGIQFTKYSAGTKGGDYYGAHKDTKLLPGGTIRKLSFTIQLSDSDAYEGGDVVLYDSLTDHAPLARAPGSISFFPSYTIHEVTPVSKGVRYSLVGWANGPPFV